MRDVADKDVLTLDIAAETSHAPGGDGPRVVILGGGPAGLTAAYELSKHGVPFTVLEQDERYVGGIARTVEHLGYRFDIGGHRFFSKSQEVEDLWTEILGDDLLVCSRLSRIYYRGRYFDYPLKALNALRSLGPIESVRCVLSYAGAKIRPRRPVRNLDDWVTNQFGKRLFQIFFKTYTEKVWGIPTTELSADWAAQRIKGLDMATVIKAALARKPKPADRGNVVKTLIEEFRYPRLGPGMLWERVRDILADRGHPVQMGRRVEVIRREEAGVVSVTAVDREGRRTAFAGSDFISSLPIRELIGSLDPPAPPHVRHAAESLSYRDFLTVALIIDSPQLFPDNWIYIHDPGVKVGRVQNFKAWSRSMVPDQSKCCLGLEYFCFEGDGLWSASDAALIELATDEMDRLEMVPRQKVVGGAVVRQPKAYPVYDDSYQQHLGVIRQWAAGAVPNLHFAGRNGMHKYNNQDHSMMSALVVARNIALGAGLDPWKVNGDAEYIEGARDDAKPSGRAVPGRVAAAR